MPRLTVVTHNVAMGNQDPAGTFDALRRTNADVILLQEAGGNFYPQLARLAALYPYHSRCRPGCDMAMFSRVRFADRPKWKLRKEDGKPFGTALIWAKLLLPGGRDALLVTWHAPWPVPGYDQMIKRRKLVESLKDVDTGHLILAGDFNLTPWARGMRKLDEGLAPSVRVTRGLFSFPARISWKAWPVPVLPIDHMFVGPGWSVLSVDRLPRTGSDHYPVKVVLALREGG
jgi:endonuclease/exonuclease/phosphatase (EEP) superfamily protein YafD